tara:strand:- start:5837 stop:7135 length:1299 start_codon:yes stop_codon:yes gene_type:complete
MLKNFILIITICLFIISCSNKETNDTENTGFSVLSYSAEISETLNLDPSNINIDQPKESSSWRQHFLNPHNNLNNIYTKASFKKKSKVISGKKGPVNIIQPIFFNDTICHVLNSGFIECYNTVSRKIIFKIDIKVEGLKKYEIVRGGIAYFDDQLVFVDGYGQIKLFNAKDGSEIWSTQIDYPILSPPLIYRGYINFISADNRIFSIDILDGGINWSFQTISENKKNLFTSSPVAFENTIIAPFSNGELVAFIYDTGQPIWSENVSKISMVSNFDIKDISASPVIYGNKVYSLSSNGKLVSVNATNGKRDWAIDLSGYRTPIVSGNQIYIINEDAKLICIDRVSSEIYWITDLSKYRKGQSVENLNLWLGPYLLNNLLYNISYFGELKIVSPISGDMLSSETIGIKGALVPPLIVSESIYLSDENSNVYEFK